MQEMPKKILIADESQNIRDILKTKFEVRGYEILTSEDGEEALNLIHEKHPDLVLLDIAIPRKNCFQICRQIKSEEGYKDISIIILSSKDQKEDEFLAKDCGADEYLIKPFIASQLEQIVKKYLEKEEAHAARERLPINEEIKKKNRQNIPHAICHFVLDSKSSAIFEQKYGAIRYSEILDKVMETIEECAKKHDEHMILEQETENKFRLLMEGKKEDIKNESDKIKTKINNLLKDLHDKGNYKKGFIRKNIQTGKEEKAPPLSIQTHVSFSESKASKKSTD